MDQHPMGYQHGTGENCYNPGHDMMGNLYNGDEGCFWEAHGQALQYFSNGDVESAWDLCQRMVADPKCPANLQVEAWMLLSRCTDDHPCQIKFLIACNGILDYATDMDDGNRERLRKETMEKLQEVEDLQEIEFVARGERPPERTTKKSEAPEWVLRGKVAGVRISAPDEAPTVSPQRNQEDQTGEDPDVCRFWKRGDCWRGADCRYIHQSVSFPVVAFPAVYVAPAPAPATAPALAPTPALPSTLASAPTENVTRSKPKSPLKRSKACRFYQEGKCRRGLECLYSHEQKEQGTVAAAATAEPECALPKQE